MPYKNEHSCRLSPPDKYSEFRRGKRQSDGKGYSIIFGKLKDEDEEKWEEQAYRYGIDEWTVGEARNHCEEHDGTFEPAGKGLLQAEYDMIIEEQEIKSGRVLSAVSMSKVLAAFEALRALIESAEREPELGKSTQLSEADKEAVQLEGIINTLKSENESFNTKQAEAHITKLLEQFCEVN